MDYGVSNSSGFRSKTQNLTDRSSGHRDSLKQPIAKLEKCIRRLHDHHCSGASPQMWLRPPKNTTKVEDAINNGNLHRRDCQ